MNFLLKIKNWCLKHVWQSVVICVVAVGAIATAITLPIVLNKDNNTEEKTAEPNDVVPSTYTVTFDLGGIGENFTVTVDKDSKLTKPEDPVSDDYKFKGWFKENTFDTEWDFDVDTVDKEMSIFAKWEVKLKGVKLSLTTLNLKVSERFQLFLLPIPENAVLTANPAWVSANPEVADVEQTGWVTAFSPGSTGIHVVYFGSMYTCSVTVSE